MTMTRQDFTMMTMRMTRGLMLDYNNLNHNITVTVQIVHMYIRQKGIWHIN